MNLHSKLKNPGGTLKPKPCKLLEEPERAPPNPTGLAEDLLSIARISTITVIVESPRPHHRPHNR